MARAVQQAQRATSPASLKSRLAEAGRREARANNHLTDAARWEKKAADYAKEEAELQRRLAAEEDRERRHTDRQRELEREDVERKMRAATDELSDRISSAEASMARPIPEPKAEKLRILMLGSSSEGDLRVGREQKRIRVAVESARHRDLVEIDVRPSATTQDLQDGISRFRPHVIHFSGHADSDLMVFEDDVDAHHAGIGVSAEAFAHAVAATDTPPLLVVLNACNTASQAIRLAGSVVPFSVGMSAEIEDGDAINYAARFYAAITDGESIRSADAAGRAALEMAGLTGHELPTLAHAADADPSMAVLVVPPR